VTHAGARSTVVVHPAAVPRQLPHPEPPCLREQLLAGRASIEVEAALGALSTCTPRIPDRWVEEVERYAAVAAVGADAGEPHHAQRLTAIAAIATALRSIDRRNVVMGDFEFPPWRTSDG
jgi:hypothetical protein